MKVPVTAKMQYCVFSFTRSQHQPKITDKRNAKSKILYEIDALI